MFFKFSVLAAISLFSTWFGHKPINDFKATPPIHIRHNADMSSPTGLSPAQIKAAYHLDTLTNTGAGKTIAIVDAYDDPTAASDLNTFSTTELSTSFPVCPTGDLTASGCFQKDTQNKTVAIDSGWALEESLDIQWAHAIAPGARIVLVEAASSSGNDLLAAVDHARTLPNVAAVSMSWGGREFSGESSYDTHFQTSGVSFFASSGDNGHGVSWPAVSKNVIGVGGTTLGVNGSSISETAWSGSGGGVSRYESKPSFQSLVNGRGRAVPDVSYDADPNTGMSVYDSTPYSGQAGWFTVGGTSAGAPQWAAIAALGSNVTNSSFYTDYAFKTAYATHFRDILTGTNGWCGSQCTATTRYDFVTGLGSPLAASF